jgi:tripartite-type tricarboxylate transporter receptor subunit TctC
MMKRLTGTLIVLCLSATSLEVAAQNYPARLVRVVVAYPAGGSIDTVARLVSQRFASATGQQFLVENRSGAAGIIGTDNVAKAAPDGYTLLMGSAAAIASAPSMYAKLPYNPQRDLAPVVLVANQPNVLLLHPSVPDQGQPWEIQLRLVRHRGHAAHHFGVVRDDDGSQNRACAVSWRCACHD